MDLSAARTDNISRSMSGQTHLFEAASERLCELNNQTDELRKIRTAKKQEEKQLKQILLQKNMQFEARFTRLSTVKQSNINKQLNESIQMIDHANDKFEAESDLSLEINQLTNDAHACRDNCDLPYVAAQMQEKNLDIEIFKHCYNLQEQEFQNYKEKFDLVEDHSEIERFADEIVKLKEKKEMMLKIERQQKEDIERKYRI